MARKYRSAAKWPQFMQTKQPICTMSLELTGKTMRNFDALCLNRLFTDMTPKRIRALRNRENVNVRLSSQPMLNVTPSLVSKWERRAMKHPQGASLKLLSLVDKKGLDIVRIASLSKRTESL